MTDSALGTTRVTQIGMVVHDIEARARAWAEMLGLPMPQIIVTDPIDMARTEYRGQPSPARAKLAFLPLGQVTLELIEPIGEASTWHEHLAARGESVHHIAFEIKGMGEKLANLADQSVPLIQRGEYTGGRYAYVDGHQQLGLILELLEND